MPEDIKNKAKQTFVDSISVKQEIIDVELYKVLIEAGDIIVNSITNEGKFLLWGNEVREALQCCDSAFVVPVKENSRIQEFKKVILQPVMPYYIILKTFYWKRLVN